MCTLFKYICIHVMYNTHNRYPSQLFYHFWQWATSISNILSCFHPFKCILFSLLLFIQFFPCSSAQPQNFVLLYHFNLFPHRNFVLFATLLFNVKFTFKWLTRQVKQTNISIQKCCTCMNTFIFIFCILFTLDVLPTFLPLLAVCILWT